MDRLPPNHPIWNIARLVILMTSLTMILYLTASKFDATEIRTIVGMFVAASGAEAISRLLPKRES